MIMTYIYIYILYNSGIFIMPCIQSEHVSCFAFRRQWHFVSETCICICGFAVVFAPVVTPLQMSTVSAPQHAEPMSPPFSRD